MPLTMTTVTGHWVGPDDQPSTGQVIIQPVASVTGGGTIIAGAQVVARLVNGTISKQVVSNTEATALQYRITEQITGGQPVSYVVTPTGPTLDLSTAPRSSASTVATFVLASQVGQPNGVPSLDSTGKVPTAQLPASSGGGVATVTAADGTIVVGGTTTNPTVGVGVIAESQVTNLNTDLAALAASVATKVAGTRQITAGTGLTGGGALSADVSLAVTYGTSSGTAAQGNDSRITGAVQASTVDAKGDLLAGTADNTLARLAVGGNGQILVADTAQASGLKYVDRSIGDFPLAGDGLIAASAPLTSFRDNSSLGAAGWAVRLWIPAGKPITTCWSSVAGAGTLGAGGVNGFAIYDDAGNLVSSTVDDNNLWATQGVRSKALPAQIAAQNSDRYVYLAMRITGYTAPPTHPFCQGQAGGQLLDGLFGGGRRRGVVLSGSTWASTIDTANGASPSGYTPFLALA
jgi:hypothetical protein